MASLIRMNGRIVNVTPANAEVFTLEELQTLVGGHIEIIPLYQGMIMIVNEDAHSLNLKENIEASSLATSCLDYYVSILGNAVVSYSNEIE